LCRAVSKQRSGPAGFAERRRKVEYETRRSELLSSVARHDISKPSDGANAALVLASDESRMMTGQSVVVDAGGYMLG
jgi:3-oxoacyl-[acyl-carrier protein] reductase